MKTKVCDDGRESSRLICAEKVQPQVKFCSKYAFVKNQLFILKFKKSKIVKNFTQDFPMDQNGILKDVDTKCYLQFKHDG